MPILFLINGWLNSQIKRNKTIIGLYLFRISRPPPLLSLCLSISKSEHILLEVFATSLRVHSSRHVHFWNMQFPIIFVFIIYFKSVVLVLSNILLKRISVIWYNEDKFSVDQWFHHVHYLKNFSILKNYRRTHYFRSKLKFWQIQNLSWVSEGFQ